MSPRSRWGRERARRVRKRLEGRSSAGLAAYFVALVRDHSSGHHTERDRRQSASHCPRAAIAVPCDGIRTPWDDALEIGPVGTEIPEQERTAARQTPDLTVQIAARWPTRTRSAGMARRCAEVRLPLP